MIKKISYIEGSLSVAFLFIILIVSVVAFLVIDNVSVSSNKSVADYTPLNTKTKIFIKTKITNITDASSNRPESTTVDGGDILLITHFISSPSNTASDNILFIPVIKPRKSGNVPFEFIKSSLKIDDKIIPASNNNPQIEISLNKLNINGTTVSYRVRTVPHVVADSSSSYDIDFTIRGKYNYDINKDGDTVIFYR